MAVPMLRGEVDDRETVQVDDGSLRAFLQHAESDMIVTPQQAQQLKDAGTVWLLQSEGGKKRTATRKGGGTHLAQAERVSHHALQVNQGGGGRAAPPPAL